MKKVFAVSLLLACATSAEAANWVMVAVPKNLSYKIFLDTESVKPYINPMLDGADYASGFVKIYFFESNDLRKEYGWRRSMNLYIANCEDSSYLHQGYLAYSQVDGEDEEVESYENKFFTKSDFQVAYPETMSLYIVKKICSNHYFNRAVEEAGER